MKINGETHYLWRAVDHDGEVLGSYFTKTPDKSAALCFLKKAMKRYGAPRTIVTDRLRPYAAAMRKIGNIDHQEVGRHLNNRAENLHLPFRGRERAMSKFKRMSNLQKFWREQGNYRGAVAALEEAILQDQLNDRHRVESRQHGINDVLMLPALDPPERPGRTARFQGTHSTLRGPVGMKRLTLFDTGEAIG